MGKQLISVHKSVNPGKSSQLNADLSFSELKKKETGKHVHALHPFKGKFIPQLVEFYLDPHKIKKDTYFKKGDILLDPFAGSGTSLVQAKEVGIHAIGIELSRFNCMIADVKLFKYDLPSLRSEIKRLEYDLSNFQARHRQHNAQKHPNSALLRKWYLESTMAEINYIFNRIKLIKDSKNKQALAVVLSKTAHASRAIAHSASQSSPIPQIGPYYCQRHKKMCKPPSSVKKLFLRYSEDTLYRISEFSKLRSDAHSTVISADSREVDINASLQKKNNRLHKLLVKQKAQGIFTSPPYLGEIDYHSEHSYAYDLFGFKRKDNSEIGSLSKGQSEKSKKDYIEDISKVLNNCSKHLIPDCNIFFVVNDKYNLYPTIAKKSGMRIIEMHKREVTNRIRRAKTSYFETVIRMKLNNKPSEA
jgi:hypothetical protein